MSFWQDRPVLITGGSGFIGTWLIRELVDRKAQVVTVVRDINGASPVWGYDAGGPIVIFGDIRDQPLLERILCDYQIKTVFHLAAQSDPRSANQNPVATFESNIRGTWTLLDACKRVHSANSIVIAGAAEAYGPPMMDNWAYKELDPMQPEWPYDVSKACSDMIAKTYAKTFGLPVTVTRCGTLFGGNDNNWDRIVPGTIRAILEKKRPVVRSNGQSVKDYLYVKDAVQGYLQLSQRSEETDLSGQVFNLSYEFPRSVEQVAKDIIELMGVQTDLDIRDSIEARFDLPIQVLDSAKAKQTFNWGDGLKGYFEGLRETINWYKGI